MNSVLLRAEAIARRRYNSASDHDRVARGLALLAIQQALAGQSPAGGMLPLADLNAPFVAGGAPHLAAPQPEVGQPGGDPSPLIDTEPVVLAGSGFGPISPVYQSN